MKLEFFLDRVSKNIQTPNFIKVPFVVAELFQMDRTKLTVAFRSFEQAQHQCRPKNWLFLVNPLFRSPGTRHCITRYVASVSHEYTASFFSDCDWIHLSCSLDTVTNFRIPQNVVTLRFSIVNFCFYSTKLTYMAALLFVAIPTEV